jgi:hypothetical protein
VNRKISKYGFAWLSLFNKIDGILTSTFDIPCSTFDIFFTCIQSNIYWCFGDCGEGFSFKRQAIFALHLPAHSIDGIAAAFESHGPAAMGKIRIPGYVIMGAFMAVRAHLLGFHGRRPNGPVNEF